MKYNFPLTPTDQANRLISSCCWKAEPKSNSVHSGLRCYHLLVSSTLHGLSRYLMLQYLTTFYFLHNTITPTPTNTPTLSTCFAICLFLNPHPRFPFSIFHFPSTSTAAVFLFLRLRIFSEIIASQHNSSLFFLDFSYSILQHSAAVPHIISTPPCRCARVPNTLEAILSYSVVL